MNLSGDHIRRVDHTADRDLAILRQVYGWAKAAPAIYLDSSGYRDAEDFLSPPEGSVEYLVFVDDVPVAFVTLIPMWTVRRVYQVGLITNPGVGLRKSCKLLRGFMGPVFGAIAEALFVALPDSPEFSRTRKLAGYFGFKQVSATTFLLLKSEYGNAQKREEADANAERDGRRQQDVQVLRHHA
jgi:hypothetical protein